MKSHIPLDIAAGALALGVTQPALAASIDGCTIGPAILCVERDLRAADLRNANLA